MAEVKEIYAHYRSPADYPKLAKNEAFRRLIEEVNISEEEHKEFLEKFECPFDMFKEVEISMERNRFWLGKKLYKEAKIYHSYYPTFKKAFSQKTYLGCVNCLDKQMASRRTIEEIIEGLQEKIF